jgi:tetratricopeptide (TPR) repeat protein
VDTVSGEYIWSQSYQTDAAGAFGLTEEIAMRVAGVLGITTVEGVSRRAPKPEAHTAYLRGRYFWNKRTYEAHQAAIGLFREAVAQDPGYAEPWAGIASSYSVMAANLLMDAQEAARLGRDAVRKALALDPASAEAHAALGQIRSVADWDWLGADAEFQQAIDLNPSYASAHQWRAFNLMYQSRFAEAATEFHEALDLDPLSLVIVSNQAEYAYFTRDYSKAREWYRKTLEMEPHFISANTESGILCAAEGKWKEAARWFHKSLELTNHEASPWVGLAVAEAGAGNRTEARRILDRLEHAGGAFPVTHYQLAVVYVALGEREKALDELERGYAERSSAMISLKVEPLLDPIRSEPRFQALVAKMRL